MTSSVTSFTPRSLLRGMGLALPIAVGVATYGLVFGILSRQVGLTFAQALFMSGSVFAGASQFIALEIWTWPLPVLPLVVTTFIVNLRHILMGAALRDKLCGLSRLQTLTSLFFLVDENWAFFLARWQQGDRDKSLLAGTGICIFLAWTLSTAVGCLISTGIDPTAWGIDFSFTAIFIFLATGLYRGKKERLPWAVAGITAATMAHFLPWKWYILGGALAGSFTGVLIHD